jgi:hypothetical protein
VGWGKDLKRAGKDVRVREFPTGGMGCRVNVMSWNAAHQCSVLIWSKGKEKLLARGRYRWYGPLSDRATRTWKVPPPQPGPSPTCCRLASGTQRLADNG